MRGRSTSSIRPDSRQMPFDSTTTFRPRDDSLDTPISGQSRENDNMDPIDSPTSTNSNNLAIFCREVRNLLRSKPNCMLPFSKFVPAYHNHYGRQCCVYQFGFTKLIELLEAIPHVVQIIGPDDSAAHRYITLTRREQIKRFASDLIKVVKAAPGKRLRLSQFARAYEQVLGRAFRVQDYGTDDINVLLVEIWEGTINIIPISRASLDLDPLTAGGEHGELEPSEPISGPLFVRVPLPRNPVLEQLVARNKLEQEPYITDQYPDCWFEIPRRERSDKEIKRTRYFVWDCIELLGALPESGHSLPFSKFIPAYHYYFNRQCKVSIFGFSKLIDLFESIAPDVVEVLDQGPGEEKLIRLARKHWPTFSSSSDARPRPHSRARAQLPAPPAPSPPPPTRILKRPVPAPVAEAAPPPPPTPAASCHERAVCPEDHLTGGPIDNGPTEEELMELEDELKAYEQFQAIRKKRSRRMAAILDIFKYSIY